MLDSEIVIIGANGQLGLALRAKYPGALAVDADKLDITDRDAVLAFDWPGKKTILNAAAYTTVDGAESDEGRVTAWKVNAAGARNLAEAALTHDLTILHISSDYVFDGSRRVHAEAEPFSPLSVYGQSKAAGDIAVSLVPRHYVLRATWVIGEGKNFVRTMLGLAGRGISPTVVADQIGRLTFTGELVRATHHLLSSAAPHGTYNVTNEGPAASWAEITRQIFALSGHGGLTVTDTTTAEYYQGKPGIAPRPLNSEMDLGKLQSTGFVSRNWQDDLKDYIKKELA
jgi:dTDP-4-dehydrorhamnose 3,5-epimerase